MARRSTHPKTSRVLITTDFAKPHANGVAHYVDLIAHTLQSTTILTYAQDGALPNERVHYTTIRRIPSFRLLGDTFRIPRAIPKMPAHDVVITNTRFFTTSTIGLLLSRRWKARHIHVEHGARHVPHHNPLVRLAAWLYDQTIGRIILSTAHTVVCVSHAGVPFARKLGANNIVVIPNAIDPDRFRVSRSTRDATRRKLGIAPNERMVLGVGRLVREKGFADLIEASKGMHHTLVIVGDGPERASLQALANKIGVKTVFTGLLAPEKLPPYYAAADVVTNPSWAEGLPTTVLEALAARKPVIASDVGGTRELIASRHLIQPRNIQELRSALKKRPTLSSLPKRMTVQSFARTWKNVLATYPATRHHEA